MNVRLLALAAVAAAGLLFLMLRTGGPGPSDRPLEPARAPRRAINASEGTGVPASPLRNVFEYAEAAPRPVASVPSARAVTRAVQEPAPPAPSPSPAVRLVGVLRRGGQIKAALAIAGEAVVLAAGESAGGYTVVSIDEEEGVRLRGPDGGTILLAPASN